MRIIVTPTGNIELQSLSLSSQKSKHSLNFSNNNRLNIKKNLTRNLTSREETSSINNIFKKNTNRNYYRTSQSSVNIFTQKSRNDAELRNNFPSSRTKFLTLTKKKLDANFKKFVENENNNEEAKRKLKLELMKFKRQNFPLSEDNESNEIFLNSKEIENQLLSKKNSTNSELSGPLLNKDTIKNSNKIQILDMISNSALEKLKTETYRENRDKLNANIQTSRTFRTKYEDPNIKINQMNEYLSYGINTNKENIIKYFQQKNCVTPISVKNLYESDNDKLNKLNVICLSLLKNQKNEKQFSNFVENKIKINSRNTQILLYQDLKDIKNNMSISRNIFSIHSHKGNNNKIYQSKLEDLNKKYWSKNRINFLSTSKNKLNYKVPFGYLSQYNQKGSSINMRNTDINNFEQNPNNNLMDLNIKKQNNQTIVNNFGAKPWSTSYQIFPNKLVSNK